MRTFTLVFPVGFAFCLAATAASKPATVTFSKDVAPILQQRCQGCHRPGEAAPFSLLTFQQARPWAKAMREAVVLKKMPPWFADPHYGSFSNDRSLSQKEIATLAAWADGGALEGDRKDLPPPVNFVEGWRIGKPDIEFEMPQDIPVPAKGTIEYTYVVVPTGFKEDRWVRMVEARPGNRPLVHHIVAFVREPGSKWMKRAEPGVPFIPRKGEDDSFGGEFLVGYAPGTVPEVMEPGQAKLIKAGSDIVLQMHYTANGTAGTDRSRIGLVFAKEPPRERVLTLGATNEDFVIPPGAPNQRVDSEFEMGSDVKLVGLLPHMHLRGKDFEYRLVYPTGETQTILSVPRYSFSWQLSYYPVKPILLPKGTKITCTAHFDNSANNADNPDPGKEVRYGDQSWEEMMIGFFNVSFDAKMDVKKLFPEKKSDIKPSAE
jgi:hypothetical protein